MESNPEITTLEDLFLNLLPKLLTFSLQDLISLCTYIIDTNMDHDPLTECLTPAERHFRQSRHLQSVFLARYISHENTG